MLAGRVACQPVDRIQRHAIETAEVLDGTAIVYRDGNLLSSCRPPLHQSCDIDDPQRRFRIAGPAGRLQDRGLHHRQLPIIHRRRPACTPAIAKTRHTTLFVPDHPVA